MGRRHLPLALALALTACDGDMNAYFARDVIDLAADLPYVDAPASPRQTLDLYLPRELRGFPVVVFVHGGYWTAHDRRYFSPVVGLYGNVGIALARRGIGVAVVGYRLVPEVTFEQQLGDVLAAVRWTQQHIAERGGDPRRMVLSGHSAGGHIVALAGLEAGRLERAGIDPTGIRGYAPLSPILDLADMAANPPEPDFNARVTTPVFGDGLARFSPRTHFRATVAPMFVALGDADEPFLLRQIPRAVDELRALGAPVTLTTLAGHVHSDLVLNFDTDRDRLSPRLADFVFEVTR